MCISFVFPPAALWPRRKNTGALLIGQQIFVYKNVWNADRVRTHLKKCLTDFVNPYTIASNIQLDGRGLKIDMRNSRNRKRGLEVLEGNKGKEKKDHRRPVMVNDEFLDEFKRTLPPEFKLAAYVEKLMRKDMEKRTGKKLAETA